MKIILFLTCFLVVFSVALSSVFYYPKPEGKPGHCWTDLTGPLEKNQVKAVKDKCEQIRCKENTVAVLTTCGETAHQNKEPDLTKPYPECCLEKS